MWATLSFIGIFISLGYLFAGSDGMMYGLLIASAIIFFGEAIS